jgi:hypothetical protein
MTLPPAAQRRQLKHRRQIDVQVYARGGGPWGLYALLTDLETRDLPMDGGVRAAGEVIDTRGHAEGAGRPFQIDRCHALKSDGEVVRPSYPRRHCPAAALPLTD